MPNTGGLEWQPIPEDERRNAKWKYRVTKPYHYNWKTIPILSGSWDGSSRLIATTANGHVVAGVTSAPGHEHSVTLRRNYAWDGSSGPFVADTPECMRASALHDVWCQAMRLDEMYENGFKNWRRGAREYRLVCIEDGMAPTRAYMRYLGLIGKGGVEVGIKVGKMFGKAAVKGVRAVGRIFGRLFRG